MNWPKAKQWKKSCANNMAEILDIVNDKDEVIGQMEREAVHAQGAICRMVFILFYTPDKKIILQRRSLSKKSNPGRLTTTVSGHVESGATYDETAVKETLEETGVSVSLSDLTNLGVVYAGYSEGDYISNAMRGLYLYEFKGSVTELKIEAGEGEGFEMISINEFWRRRTENPDDLSLYLLDSLGEKMIKTIEAL